MNAVTEDDMEEIYTMEELDEYVKWVLEKRVRDNA